MRLARASLRQEVEDLLSPQPDTLNCPPVETHKAPNGAVDSLLAAPSVREPIELHRNQAGHHPADLDVAPGEPSGRPEPVLQRESEPQRRTIAGCHSRQLLHDPRTDVRRNERIGCQVGGDHAKQGSSIARARSIGSRLQESAVARTTKQFQSLSFLSSGRDITSDRTEEGFMRWATCTSNTRGCCAISCPRSEEATDDRSTFGYGLEMLIGNRAQEPGSARRPISGRDRRRRGSSSLCHLRTPRAPERDAAPGLRGSRLFAPSS